MTTPPAPSRAGRLRAVALDAPAGTPLGRRSRLRAAAAAGGLAVLLGGSFVGHLPAATATTATSASSVLTSATTGLSAAGASLGAVARTGGRP